MSLPYKRTAQGFYVMTDDTHISKWTEQEGRLDHARGFLEQFRHLIPDGGIVVDAGACIGDHTITYAQMVGPTGQVLAFEANPGVAECCRLNMEPFPWVKVVECGLSSGHSAGELIKSENVGASYIMAGSGITLMPLDHWTKDLPRLDFIKVDIEGMEPSFLDGAKQTLADFSPAILMEVNKGALHRQAFTPNAIFLRLVAAGYDWIAVDGKIGMDQYDILAIKSK